MRREVAWRAVVDVNPDNSATLVQVSFISDLLPVIQDCIFVSPSLVRHSPHPACVYTPSLWLIYPRTAYARCTGAVVYLRCEVDRVATGGGYELPQKYAIICKIKSPRPVQVAPHATRDGMPGMLGPCLTCSVQRPSRWPLLAVRMQPADVIEVSGEAGGQAGIHMCAR